MDPHIVTALLTILIGFTVSSFVNSLGLVVDLMIPILVLSLPPRGYPRSKKLQMGSNEIQPEATSQIGYAILVSKRADFIPFSET